MISKRIYGLDIVRAFAILFVIYSHSFFFLHRQYFVLVDGVSLFFVLSGFLIGQILLKIIHQTAFGLKDVVHFWIRRWFRTLPVYYFVITLLIIFHFYAGDSYSFSQNVEHYFFIQNTSFDSLFPESWSLKIEEWFYVVVPALFFVSLRFKKISKRKIVLFWIVLFLFAGTAIRTYNAVIIADNHDWRTMRDFILNLRFAFFSRIDSIMYGMLGAFLAYYKFSIWNRRNFLFSTGLVILLITCISNNMEFNLFTKYFQISFESLATLMLLPKLSALKEGKGVLFKFLTFTSTISYSIYLLNAKPFNLFMHITRIKLLMIDMVGKSYQFPELIFYVLWCFGGGYILYRCVEKPMMQLREKITWPYKKKDQQDFKVKSE